MIESDITDECTIDSDSYFPPTWFKHGNSYIKIHDVIGVNERSFEIILTTRNGVKFSLCYSRDTDYREGLDKIRQALCINEKEYLEV